MILSHKHKFIFLKTNKTAGTSIEIALSKICGEDDIITPISAVDEEKRRQAGYRGPQNYLLPPSQYSLKDWAKRILRGEKKRQFYNHISAREVKQAIGDEIWNSYYKFCFERNPWDRVISHYYWHYKTEPRPSILEYLDSDKPEKIKQRGFGVYTIDGELAVDKVYKFEELSDSLEDIRQKLDITETFELPRTKSGTRKDKRSYQEILSEAEKNRVASLFNEEIRLFDYRFEG